MDREQAALAQIRATFLRHESLRERWQRADAPPEGSELARADAVWPHLPFTEHARQCLASAWDHFDVVRLVIDAQRTFPTGLNGVLRGGLVAAATAYWLLGPEEAAQRDQRGLALTDEWYTRRIKFQSDYLASLPEEDAHAREQIDYLRDDQTKARQLRTTKLRVQATSIIDWSAGQVWGHRSRQHSKALLEWQRLGGDAHALGWQLLAQNVQWAEDGEGPVRALVSGSLMNIAEPYLCANGLFEAALSRFDYLTRARP